MKKLLISTLLIIPCLLFSQKIEKSTDQYTALRGEGYGNCTGSKSNICGFEQKENSAIVLSKEGSTQLKISIDLSKTSDQEQIGWMGKSLKEVRPNEEIPFVQEFKIPLDADLI